MQRRVGLDYARAYDDGRGAETDSPVSAARFCNPDRLLAAAVSATDNTLAVKDLDYRLRRIALIEFQVVPRADEANSLSSVVIRNPL